MKRVNSNLRLIGVDRRVNTSKMTASLSLYDVYKPHRKSNRVIVLKDLPPYMLAHLAKQCKSALRELHGEVERCVEEVTDA